MHFAFCVIQTIYRHLNTVPTRGTGRTHRRRMNIFVFIAYYTTTFFDRVSVRFLALASLAALPAWPGGRGRPGKPNSNSVLPLQSLIIRRYAPWRMRTNSRQVRNSWYLPVDVSLRSAGLEHDGTTEYDIYRPCWRTGRDGTD